MVCLGTFDKLLFAKDGRARERLVSSKIMDTVRRSPKFLLFFGDRFNAFRGPLSTPI
jgi:hypothetical protein